MLNLANGILEQYREQSPNRPDDPAVSPSVTLSGYRLCRFEKVRSRLRT
jgi:hypothetical protein